MLVQIAQKGEQCAEGAEGIGYYAEKVQAGPPYNHEHEQIALSIGSLLRTSAGCCSQLQRGKFNENNQSGYVSLNVYNVTGPYEVYRDGPVGKIEVCFVGLDGVKTALGKIERVEGTTDKGLAFRYLGETKGFSEEINPESEWWDVVVGTIERAICAC